MSAGPPPVPSARRPARPISTSKTQVYSSSPNALTRHQPAASITSSRPGTLQSPITKGWDPFLETATGFHHFNSLLPPLPARNCPAPIKHSKTCKKKTTYSDARQLSLPNGSSSGHVPQTALQRSHSSLQKVPEGSPGYLTPNSNHLGNTTFLGNTTGRSSAIHRYPSVPSTNAASSCKRVSKPSNDSTRSSSSGSQLSSNSMRSTSSDTSHSSHMSSDTSHSSSDTSHSSFASFSSVNSRRSSAASHSLLAATSHATESVYAASSSSSSSSCYASQSSSGSVTDSGDRLVLEHTTPPSSEEHIYEAMTTESLMNVTQLEDVLEWTPRSYSPMELSQKSVQWPVIAKIDQGYYEEDEENELSGNQIVVLRQWHQQKRVLAKSSKLHGITLSVPIEPCPLKFEIIYNKKGFVTVSGIMTLQGVLDSQPGQFPIRVQFFHPQHIGVKQGSKFLYAREFFGELTLTGVYEEVYLSGCTVNDGNLNGNPLLLHQASKVNLKAAVGMTESSDDERDDKWGKLWEVYGKAAVDCLEQNFMEPTEIKVFKREQMEVVTLTKTANKKLKTPLKKTVLRAVEPKEWALMLPDFYLRLYDTNTDQPLGQLSPLNFDQIEMMNHQRISRELSLHGMSIAPISVSSTRRYALGSDNNNSPESRDRRPIPGVRHHSAAAALSSPAGFSHSPSTAALSANEKRAAYVGAGGSSSSPSSSGGRPLSLGGIQVLPHPLTLTLSDQDPSSLYASVKRPPNAARANSICYNGTDDVFASPSATIPMTTIASVTTPTQGTAPPVPPRGHVEGAGKSMIYGAIGSTSTTDRTSGQAEPSGSVYGMPKQSSPHHSNHHHGKYGGTGVKNGMMKQSKSVPELALMDRHITAYHYHSESGGGGSRSVGGNDSSDGGDAASVGSGHSSHSNHNSYRSDRAEESDLLETLNELIAKPSVLLDNDDEPSLGDSAATTATSAGASGNYVGGDSHLSSPRQHHHYKHHHGRRVQGSRSNGGGRNIGKGTGKGSSSLGVGGCLDPPYSSNSSNSSGYTSAGSLSALKGLSRSHKQLYSSSHSLASSDVSSVSYDLTNTTGNIESYNVNEISDCLRLLKLEQHIESFMEHQVDGALLKTLDEDILKTQFGLNSFEARKLTRFAAGWRPRS